MSVDRGGLECSNWTFGDSCGRGLDQEGSTADVSSVPTSLEEVRVLLRREGEWTSL